MPYSLLATVCGSFYELIEVLWDGAYVLRSFYEKTWKSDHLQM